MKLVRALRVAPVALSLSLFSAIGCATSGATTHQPGRGGDEVPRAEGPLDLEKLAREIEQSSAPPRPIWSTLPAHVRRAVEARLAAFSTVAARAAEVERRRGSYDLRDETATAAFAELFFLLEELAFGPPSDARTEAYATLSSLYVIAERTGDFARWSERLAKSLDLPTGDGDFSAFLRAFAEGGAAMHRAYVAAALREKAPKPALARALSSHAWYVHGKGDLDRALWLREAALRLEPDQSADAWITLGTSYALGLDGPRAAKALAMSERAKPGAAKASDLATRRAELQKKIALVRSLDGARAPSTPEERLALGETLRGIGAEARAEKVLEQALRELPGDARPRIGLARLRLQRAAEADLPRLARDVVASLEPARKMDHRTSELYELWFGLSGLTALEDVLRAGKDPEDVLKRAAEVVARFRAANAEHAALAPPRAAALGVVLDLATEGVAAGPRFVEQLPALLRDAYPKARAVHAKHPTDPGARMIGVSLASFSPEPDDAFAFVVAKPEIPDPPLLIATRAEIALDLAIASGDEKRVMRARDLADEVPKGERVRDARAAAVRGDAEVFLARTGKGSLDKAEAHYREALKGLPTGEQTRVKANLGWVLAKAGKPELGADTLRDAVGTAAKETNAAMAMTVMATFALTVRQLDDVEALVTKALALDPGNAVASMARALAHKQRGHVEEAREDAKRAMERIDKSVAVTPRRQWGAAGSFGDASLDFNLGISSDSPVYDLRMSAFHRTWWLFQPFDLAEIRALTTAPPAPPPAPPKAPPKKKK